jgi:3-oxoacyl-[acyl-carrier-protein] synthase II
MLQAHPKPRVVVTGMGAVTPLGLDLKSTWENALQGQSGIKTIESFDSSMMDVHIAGEIKGFDPSSVINKKDIRRMDRFIHLGLAASFEALDQSKIEGKVAPERIGTVLSSGIGGMPMIEQTVKDIANKKRVSPFFIPAVISNLLPGQLSLIRGFKGPNFCITSACSSSAHSIGEGMRMIQRGDVDAAVVGGAEAPLCTIGMAGFASMKALSTRNDSPEKASRPFDKDRDGFVMAEGGAVLVIESLESAEKRGAEIIAELVGYGANSDAYHLTAPSEAGEGAIRCMTLALEDAGLKSEDIGYINMHGTSTPVGDVAESTAIGTLFNHWKDSGTVCSSTKSMTGHLLGAAGSLESIFAIKAAIEKKIPPTINLENQDEKCPLDYCPLEARSVSKVNYALSNSFGFGGTNASLIFKSL